MDDPVHQPSSSAESSQTVDFDDTVVTAEEINPQGPKTSTATDIDSELDDPYRVKLIEKLWATSALVGTSYEDALEAWAGRKRKRPNWEGSSARSNNRRRSIDSLPSSCGFIEDPEEEVSRSAKARALCAKRDKNTCLITRGEDQVDIANIYPVSLGSRDEKVHQALFWSVMGTFWTAEKTDSWKEQIFGWQGTKICENLMTLAPTVRRLWRDARFALKPIKLSADRRSLEVEFRWLPLVKRRSINYITEPPCLPRDLDCCTPGIKLFNSQTEKKIVSGDVLVFRTEDPDNLPLPSMELLEMQWIRNRALALSGAVNGVDDCDSDSGITIPMLRYLAHEEDAWNSGDGDNGEF